MARVEITAVAVAAGGFISHVSVFHAAIRLTLEVTVAVVQFALCGPVVLVHFHQLTWRNIT